MEEVQQLQEGESITLFRGEVICGASLYIADADKFTREAIQINRFIEVAPPDETALLAQAPASVRRRAVRAGAVQQILRHLEAPESRSDLENLQLTDPTLATLIALEGEWHSLWRCPPSSAVRGSLLWETARRCLHHRGRRYQA